MNRLWRSALSTLLLIAALAFLADMAFGRLVALMFFSGLLLTCVVWHVWQLGRLWKVLDGKALGGKTLDASDVSDAAAMPDAPGLWGEIWYRLDRLTRRWQTHAEETERQHVRFIAAIQASPNGVLMLDRDNRIEWCNQAAEQHFGLDARRDRLQQVTHLLRWPEYVAYLQGGNFSEPLVMRDTGGNPSGSTAAALASSASPVFPVLPLPQVLSVQLFPYGDARKLQLSYDISALERVEAMRRDFVANVSHELKSPLTVLAGFLETLRDLPLSTEERDHYLEIMQTQSQRMQRIVEDLLTLARLEDPAQKPASEVIDMQALLAQLRHDAENLSNGQHTIESRCTAQVNLIGDGQEIRSAFANLVFNAVRYTPSGGRIELAWAEDRDKDSAHADEAVFSVRDSGVGIAPQHIPRLTERFYRIDSSRSRNTGGTGLGLAIVKHVLSRHGSELLIESRQGGSHSGSTFSARFTGGRLAPFHADGDS